MAQLNADVLASQVRVDVTDGVVGVNVSLEHIGIGDEDVGQLLQLISACGTRASTDGKAIPAGYKANTGVIPVNLAVEMNFISSDGIKQLLQTWASWRTENGARSRLHLRRLRLHMNRIDDAGADSIAAYIRTIDAEYLPHEVHLSHNRITAVGALALLRACEARYPRAGLKGFPTPLWLRLEHNQIDMRALATAAAREALRFCTRSKPQEGPGAGRGRGRGGRAGPQGRPALRCGPGFCVLNASLQAKAKAYALSMESDHRPGHAHALPHWHPKAVPAHCPYLQEQRPPNTGAATVAGLASRAAAPTVPVVARPVPVAPAPASKAKASGMDMSTLGTLGLGLGADGELDLVGLQEALLDQFYGPQDKAGGTTAVGGGAGPAATDGTPDETDAAVAAALALACSDEGRGIEESDEEEDEDDEEKGQDEVPSRPGTPLLLQPTVSAPPTAPALAAPETAPASSAGPATVGQAAVGPVYLVLDTSAVLHMMPGYIANGEARPFSFPSLGLCPTNTQALWASSSGESGRSFVPAQGSTDGSASFVLLETVLQQLDDNKKPGGETGNTRTRACVNSFMRLYPLLEECGALVRLAGEDAEDRVRSGGLHVATSPGLRGLDGRFDSDGLIVDASLVLLRALVEGWAAVHTAGPGTSSPPLAVLVTCDIRMRNRAREARLPAVLLDDLEAGWMRVYGRQGGSGAGAQAGGRRVVTPLTRTAVLAALPPDATRLVQAASGPAPATASFASPGKAGLQGSLGPDMSSPGQAASPGGLGMAPSGSPVLAGRVPHLELASAAGTVEDLVQLLKGYTEAHGQNEKDGTCGCELCTRAAALCPPALSSASVWRALHDSRRTASSLHAALYRHGQGGPVAVQGTGAGSATKAPPAAFQSSPSPARAQPTYSPQLPVPVPGRAEGIPRTKQADEEKPYAGRIAAAGAAGSNSKPKPSKSSPAQASAPVGMGRRARLVAAALAELEQEEAQVQARLGAAGTGTAAASGLPSQPHGKAKGKGLSKATQKLIRAQRKEEERRARQAAGGGDKGHWRGAKDEDAEEDEDEEEESEADEGVDEHEDGIAAAAADGQPREAGHAHGDDEEGQDDEDDDQELDEAALHALMSRMLLEGDHDGAHDGLDQHEDRHGHEQDEDEEGSEDDWYDEDDEDGEANSDDEYFAQIMGQQQQGQASPRGQGIPSSLGLGLGLAPGMDFDRGGKGFRAVKRGVPRDALATMASRASGRKVEGRGRAPDGASPRGGRGGGAGRGRRGRGAAGGRGRGRARGKDRR